MKRLTPWIMSLLLTLTTPPALASRTVSLPFSLSFNDSSWTADLALEECGGTSTHSTSGCFSGGCMKVTPPSSPCTGGGINGGQTGLGWVSYPGTSRIHVRFLIYFGSSYAENVAGGLINKFLLQDAPSRTGILGLNASDTAGRYLAWGVLDVNESYIFRSPPNRGWIEDAEFRISTAEHSEQWLSVEYWIDTTTAETGLNIWDRAGNSWTIDGVTAESAVNQTGFYISYFNCYGTADADNYYLMDDLVVDDEFIGPPIGFVSGGAMDGGQPADMAALDATITVDAGINDLGDHDTATADVTLVHDSAAADFPPPEDTTTRDGPGQDAIDSDSEQRAASDGGADSTVKDGSPLRDGRTSPHLIGDNGCRCALTSGASTPWLTLLLLGCWWCLRGRARRSLPWDPRSLDAIAHTNRE